MFTLISIHLSSTHDARHRGWYVHKKVMQKVIKERNPYTEFGQFIKRKLRVTLPSFWSNELMVNIYNGWTQDILLQC